MDIQEKSICVIVITYNPLQWIEKCIESVFNSTVKTELLIIDNNSKDGFQTKIKDILKKYKVNIIQLDNNIGFGQANNIGLRFALENNFEYVFLLNQDAYVKKDTIENLINTSLMYPEYGILSPLQLDGEGTRLDFRFADYVHEKNCPNLISDFILGDTLKDIYDLNFVNAAAWLFPINTLTTIGGFDPIFFHYGEDNNYCQRVLFHGLKVGIVPNSFILHDRHQESYKSNRNQSFVLFERSIKTNCGNINFSFENQVKQEFNVLLRKTISSLFRLNFAYFIKWLKFYPKFKSIIKDVKNSRAINENKGPNYLNSQFSS